MVTVAGRAELSACTAAPAHPSIRDELQIKFHAVRNAGGHGPNL